jgi:hypothetical protein
MLAVAFYTQKGGLSSGIGEQELKVFCQGFFIEDVIANILHQQE